MRNIHYRFHIHLLYKKLEDLLYILLDKYILVCHFQIDHFQVDKLLRDRKDWDYTNPVL